MIRFDRVVHVLLHHVTCRGHQLVATLDATGAKLYVDGVLTATITTSGEPDVVDHETATEAVRRYITTL